MGSVLGVGGGETPNPDDEARALGRSYDSPAVHQQKSTMSRLVGRVGFDKAKKGKRYEFEREVSVEVCGFEEDGGNDDEE